MNKIHITTARKILESPEPVELTVLTTKAEMRTYKNAVGLRRQHYAGSRNIKLLDSGEIRKIRDCLILAINGSQVFW